MLNCPIFVHEWLKSLYDSSYRDKPLERGDILRKSLNKKDKAILEFVQQNGLLSNQEISDATSIPKSTVNKRLKRLVSLGYIKGNRAILDPFRLNQSMGTFILIGLHLSDLSRSPKLKRTREIAHELSKLRGVQSVYVTTGDYDVIIRARSRDNYSLFDDVIEPIRMMPEVRVTKTYIDMVKPPKESLDVKVEIPEKGKLVRANNPSRESNLNLSDPKDMLPFPPWFEY